MNGSEPRPLAPLPVRMVLMAVGFVSLGLGIVGLVLPVLPTTPFVLLASVCFARSSPRFHAWLLNARLFGPLIRNWDESRSFSKRAKTSAVASIAIVGGGSAFWIVEPLWARSAMVAVLAAVSVWIVTRPTAPSAGEMRPSAGQARKSL